MECLDELGPTADPNDLIEMLVRKQYITTFQASKLERRDPDGYFLGGYKLLYKIASGTFGRVYRAEDPRTGAVVALKVLRRRWTEDNNKIVLFEREGKFGMRLHHPNIVQILGVNCDRTSNQFFIVMEFVEGTNLRSLLSVRKKLPLPEAMKILEESAAGLADAFAHGMTHRDIKPSNILLSTQGVAKLVDFGLTELTSKVGYSLIEDENINVDRTVDYAGLERATNVPPGDPRSDIFFLGCVFYEMLSGRPALPPTKDRRVRMQKQRFEQIKPLTKDDVPEAPPSVFQLLDRMMSLDPQRRFQNPQQLLEAIHAVQAELAAGASASASSNSQPTVFVVEKREKLQELLRQKFKNLGFRVLLSIDPKRALQAFRQKPFEALVLDVGTLGESALDVFDEFCRDANRSSTRCIRVVLLAEDQDWMRTRIREGEDTVVLTFPLKKGALEQVLSPLLPSPSAPPVEAEVETPQEA
ncbi:MAG: serine/threonine-protein kinase [Gemmataceae bacterium]|nr:serine/threonine-protein kinase [Gemmataceae bacterium]